MGTWSAGLFGSDMALDMKAEWTFLYSIMKTPEEAIKEMEKQFNAPSWDDRSDAEFWMVLSWLTQSFGCLTPKVKRKAIAAMESGRDINAWTGIDQSQRRQVHKKLRARLEGPQPKPRKRKAIVREVTPFKVGDLVRVDLKSGQQRLLWAGHPRRYRGEDLMLFLVFAWSKDRAPTQREFELLRPLMTKNQRFNNEFIRDQRAKGANEGTEEWIRVGMGGTRACSVLMPVGSHMKDFPPPNVRKLEGSWKYENLEEVPGGPYVPKWTELEHDLSGVWMPAEKWEIDAAMADLLAERQRSESGKDRTKN